MLWLRQLTRNAFSASALLYIASTAPLEDRVPRATYSLRRRRRRFPGLRRMMPVNGTSGGGRQTLSRRRAASEAKVEI